MQQGGGAGTKPQGLWSLGCQFRVQGAKWVVLRTQYWRVQRENSGASKMSSSSFWSVQAATDPHLRWRKLFKSKGKSTKNNEDATTHIRPECACSHQPDEKLPQGRVLRPGLHAAQFHPTLTSLSLSLHPRVSLCSRDWPGRCCVEQAGLKFLRDPPAPAFPVLGLKASPAHPALPLCFGVWG